MWSGMPNASTSREEKGASSWHRARTAPEDSRLGVKLNGNPSYNPRHTIQLKHLHFIQDKTWQIRFDQGQLVCITEVWRGTWDNFRDIQGKQILRANTAQ